jgi:hypothetical protein
MKAYHAFATLHRSEAKRFMPVESCVNSVSLPDLRKQTCGIDSEGR